jgi:hypothetical protein
VDPAADDGFEDEIEDQPIGDRNWTIRRRTRTRGTVQKDWFEAPASDFENELHLCVIGRRGWLSEEQQDSGFRQRYAVAISIEVVGIAIRFTNALRHSFRSRFGYQFEPRFPFGTQL